MLRAGDITLYEDTHRVFRGEREVKLTSLEFALLAWLMERKNTVCTRDDIVDGVWGRRFHYDTGTLDVHIAALRRKLMLDRLTGPIRTVRGTGFKFVDREPVNPETFRTVSLRPFIGQMLTAHAQRLAERRLHTELRLDPFVSDITTDEQVFGELFGQLLELFSRCAAEESTLHIASAWEIHAFTLSVEGTAAPPYPNDAMLQARYLAALLGMPLLMEQRGSTLHAELSVPLRKD